jgi:NitT/TauT family transport system substrate-binding protein/putative hydroxymethylpyrimidine transport system substrate-binding protein
VIAGPGIGRPRELEGKRVGVTGAPSDEAVLRAVVEGDGGDYDRVERTTIGFSAVPSLIAGRVDAVVAFWNAEGVALRERGLRTREFRLDDYGAPSYPELVLVARRDGLTETLASLTSAIAAGNRAALADRAGTVDRMVGLSGADEALVRAQVAAIAPVLSRDLRLDRAALEAWARFDARYGILRSRLAIRRVFRTGFIEGP